MRLTGDDDARTSPAKVGELERIPSYGRRRRSRCAQSERYPWSVLTHSMDGRGEAQWPSPPTVRKREQRVVIYQLSLRVSVSRVTANDGAGIEGLALLLSRSICRRLNRTTLCDGFNRREAPDCRVSPKFAESESKSSCRLGARGSSETTNERRSRTKSNRSTAGRCWHRSQAAIFLGHNEGDEYRL